MKIFKTLSKRGLALFLVLAMCMSLLPTTAIAAEQTHTHGEDGWTCVEEQQLVCTKDVHVHTDECFPSEPDADPDGETEEDVTPSEPDADAPAGDVDTPDAGEPDGGEESEETTDPVQNPEDSENEENEDAAPAADPAPQTLSVSADVEVAEDGSICGKEAHTHTAECYAMVWKCVPPSANVVKFLNTVKEISAEVTMDDEVFIVNARSIYDTALTETEKEHKSVVAAYAKLTDAEAALEALKTPAEVEPTLVDQEMEATSDDGMTFAASGPMPEGAQLSVETVESNVADYVTNDVLKLEQSEDYTTHVYDIKILDAEGNEWQPTDGSVQITIKNLVEAETETAPEVSVYHILDDAEAIEKAMSDSAIRAKATVQYIAKQIAGQLWDAFKEAINAASDAANVSASGREPAVVSVDLSELARVLEDGSLVFSTESFSIYAITVPNKTATYRFQDADGNVIYIPLEKPIGDQTTVDKQVLKLGQPLQFPGAASKVGGRTEDEPYYVFKGWYNGETQIPDTYTVPEADLEKEITITPKFDEYWHVTFQNADGTVAYVAAVKCGEALSEAEVEKANKAYVPETAGNTVDGWTYEPALDGGKPTSNVIATATAEKTGVWVEFDSDGGTPVNALFPNADGHVTDIPTAETMKKPGYTFEGWYLEDGTTPFTSETKVDSVLKVKAHWTATEGTYTIQYWIENADDDGYTYVGSDNNQPGKVGETVGSKSDSELLAAVRGHIEKNLPEIDNTQFEYDNRAKDKTAQANNGVKIQGDGSTIFNVYFSRKSYTLTFTGTELCGKEKHTHITPSKKIASKDWNDGCYLRTCGQEAVLFGHSHSLACYDMTSPICGKEEHTHDSSCRTLTFTCKYGKDLTDVWAEVWKSTGTECHWTLSTNSNVYLNYQAKMPGNKLKLTYGSTSTDKSWSYWLQGLDGEYYQKWDNFYTGSGSDLTYDEEYFDITGFEQVDKPGENGWDYSSDYKTYSKSFSGHLQLKYNRRSYPLTFDNGAGTTIKEYDGDKKVLYEKPLSTYCDAVTPTDAQKPAGKENCTFGGWATDPAGKNPVAVNAIMPAGPLTLYAIWIAQPCTITVVDTDGKEYPVILSEGDKLNDQQALIDKLSGINAEGILGFQQGSSYIVYPFTVSGNITLTIVRSGANYGVKYENQDGSTAGTDEKPYVLGAQATVITGPGDNFDYWTVQGDTSGKKYYPGDLVTVTESTVLIAHYKNPLVGVVEITYHPGFTGTGVKDHTAGARTENGTLQLANSFWTREGFTFLGWATSAGGEKVFDAGANVFVDAASFGANELWAVWTQERPEEYAITVTAYSGTYDGQGHGVAVSGNTLEGDVTEYSDDNGTTWSQTPPSRTNVTGETPVTVKVRVTNPGYQTAEASGTITITPATPEITMSDKSVAYGETVDMGATVTLVNNEPYTGTISYMYTDSEGSSSTTVPTAVGEYTVTASIVAQGNYTAADTTATLRITKATPASSLNATGGTWTYDGAPHSGSASVEDAAGNPDTSYTVEYSVSEGEWTATPPSVKDVSDGSKTVSVRATSNNYETLTGSYTIAITARPVTITVDSKDKFFDKEEPEFTGSITSDLKLVAAGDLGEISYYRTNSDEAVGTYKKVLDARYTENGNYAVTVNKGDFTIKTANSTSTIDPQPDPNATATVEGTGWTWVYDGEAHSTTAVVKTKDGAVDTSYTVYYKVGNGEWATTVPEVTNVSEGTVTVSVKATKTGYSDLTADNYTIAITPKPVTVTADDQEMVYGGAEPTLTATVSGNLNNDPIAYDAPTRAEGTTVGAYGITVTVKKDQGNYTVTPVDGKLTIKGQVIYHANAEDVTNVPAVDSKKAYELGVEVLREDLTTDEPVRENYTFAGWSLTEGENNEPLTDAEKIIMGTTGAHLYAVWTQNTYTVKVSYQLTDDGETFESYTGSDVTSSAVVGYPRGWSVVVSQVSLPGATITAPWSIEKEAGGEKLTYVQDVDASDKALTGTAPAYNSEGTEVNVKLVYALDTNGNFIPDYQERFTLTYNANGGKGNVPTDENEYAQNETVTLATSTELTKDKAVFLGWSRTEHEDLIKSAEAKKQAGLIEEVTFALEDITVFAVWAEDKNGNGTPDYEDAHFTVTYTDGVDGEVVFEDQVYENVLDGLATPKFKGTPTRTEYVFAGWAPAVADEVTESVTYVAQWAEDKLIDPSIPEKDRPANGGDGIADKYQITVNFAAVNGTVDDAKATFTFVTKRDKDGNLVENGGQAILTAEHIPATRADTGYTGGTWSPVTPAVGLDVLKVFSNGVATAAEGDGINPNVNKFTITYEKIVNTITIEVVNGTSSASSIYVPYGENSARITFSGNQGYVLGSATVDGAPVSLDDDTYTFYGVVKDHTIRVVYVQGTFTATFVDGQTGAILETRSDLTTLPAETTYPAAPEHEGYDFIGWTVAGPDADGNYTITANYEPVEEETFKVIFKDDVTGETIEERPGIVELPNEGTYPAAPEHEGYDFSGWVVTGPDADGNYTISATYTEKDVPPTPVGTHTVTWVNWNGARLQQVVVNDGDAEPDYTGAAPVRPSDTAYTYTFRGWSAPVVDADGNVTYTAQYTPSAIVPEGPDVPVGPTEPVTPTPPTVIPDNPVPLAPPTTTITDQDVPLAGAIGLNDVDHFAYVIGYDDDTVRPLNNITRAEVATIFFRLMTDEYRTANWATTNDFSDVKAGSWYNNAISTCAKAGLLTGYPDGTFKPNQSITRAEFAAIAARFLSDEVTGENVGDFSDTANHWAAKEIRRAAEAGWVTGSNNAFRPNDKINRAEVMTIVNRMLDRIPDAEHMLETMKKWTDNPEGTWYYEAVQEATNEHAYERDELGVTETWTEILEARDWKALEAEWASANAQ